MKTLLTDMILAVAVSELIELRKRKKQLLEKEEQLVNMIKTATLPILEHMEKRSNTFQMAETKQSVTVYHSSNSRVDPKALRELGVDEVIIELSTVKTEFVVVKTGE